VNGSTNINPSIPNICFVVVIARLVLFPLLDNDVVLIVVVVVPPPGDVAPPPPFFLGSGAHSLFFATQSGTATTAAFLFTVLQPTL
jgi:hypothetical protein